jgi:hypothetical protein
MCVLPVLLIFANALLILALVALTLCFALTMLPSTIEESLFCLRLLLLLYLHTSCFGHDILILVMKSPRVNSMEIREDAVAMRNGLHARGKACGAHQLLQSHEIVFALPYYGLYY